MDFVRFSFLVSRFSKILFNFPTIIYLNAIVVCARFGHCLCFRTFNSVFHRCWIMFAG